MKYMTRMFMLTLTLLPMLAAAQIEPDTRLQAQVPFDFVIGSKIVPAGQFSVQSAAPGAITLAMRNPNAKINMVANPTRVESKKPATTNALVFHKYGQRYFLWEVKVEGSRIMYQLPEGRAEAELRAQNVQAPEEVLLALK